jgi:hypothetical protein
MTEHDRRRHNAACLDELFPTFRDRVLGIIDVLEQQGCRPRIKEAWRSRQEQLRRFKAGDARMKFDLHNVTGKNGEKEALAADLLDDDAPDFPSTRFLLLLAAAARWHGCQTGILTDLEEDAQAEIIAAMDRKAFDAPIRPGREPTRVVPLGITAPEARHGKRPGPTLLAANSNASDVLHQLYGD